jgi:hypothetical protein
MNIFEEISLILTLVSLKEGTFSYRAHGVKFNATLTETAHTAPLGKITLSQALSLVAQISSGVSTSAVVRIGSNDFTLVTSLA